MVLFISETIGTNKLKVKNTTVLKINIEIGLLIKIQICRCWAHFDPFYLGNGKNYKEYFGYFTDVKKMFKRKKIRQNWLIQPILCSTCIQTQRTPFWPPLVSVVRFLIYSCMYMYMFISSHLFCLVFVNWCSILDFLSINYFELWYKKHNLCRCIWYKTPKIGSCRSLYTLVQS